MQLTTNIKTALEAWKTGSDAERQLLEKLFGKDPFKASWLEDLKEACTALNIDFTKALPYPDPESKEQEVINAYAALRILAKYTRKEWEPNWNNSNQLKYYPWFAMRSGSGFSFCDYGYANAISAVGSRLCFPTEEMARSFGIKYLSLYETVFTN